jgi:RHS repeat-associated protein
VRHELLCFSGKERDAETSNSAMGDGLDHFGARYMSGAQGRFTTSDEPLTYAEAENPQSWNSYSYVDNNPLNFVDDDGHFGYCANGTDPTGKACNPSPERGRPESLSE